MVGCATSTAPVRALGTPPIAPPGESEGGSLAQVAVRTRNSTSTGFPTGGTPAPTAATPTTQSGAATAAADPSDRPPGTPRMGTPPPVSVPGTALPPTDASAGGMRSR